MLRALSASVAVAVAFVAGVVGCGGDDDTSNTSSDFSMDPVPTVSIAHGCTEAYPLRLRVEPPEYEALGRFCASEDFTGLTLENVSKKVLRVWNPQNAPPAMVEVSEPEVSDAGDIAALEAVPGVCQRDYADCVLPAGATATARGDGPVTLRFAVLPEATIRANSARGLASWAQARVTTRARSLALRSLGCASAAGNLAEESPYLADALRLALTSYDSCKGFVDDVLRRSGADATPPASAYDDVLGVTRKVAGGSFTDELVYTAIKIIPRGP